MRYVLVLIGLLAIQGAAPKTVVDGNWPQWRGPSQDGVSRETGLPSEWGAKCARPDGSAAGRSHSRAGAAPDRASAAGTGQRRFGGGREGRPIVHVSCEKMETKNIAWKLPLPAYSGSTPIIWGDTIFLNVATAANTGALELWAIDRTQADGRVEAADRRRQPHGAQAEHVVAVAGHRRQARLGDDRRRRAQGVRLRRQGTLVAQHPDRLRHVRPQLGLRLVAAAARRRALRAGAARHEDRRSVVRAEDRRDDGQDDLARRAADRRGERIAGLVHDAGLDRRRRPRRARDHRRRRRLRPRSRRRARNSGAPTSSTRSATATTASSRRRRSSAA